MTLALHMTMFMILSVVKVVKLVKYIQGKKNKHRRGKGKEV